MLQTIIAPNGLSTPSHLKTVLQAFHIQADASVIPFGNGLINRTWKVTTPNQEFVLQWVNSDVFNQPADIAHNIKLIADYLALHSPDYLFVSPIAASAGGDLLHVEGQGYFRLFPFVENSNTIIAVETPGQAYEAAAQFGKFTRLLSGFDARQLKITIPDFHDLSLRYQQFLAAAEKGNKQRIAASGSLIKQLKSHSDIVALYKKIPANKEFKVRVTHHDTKISNVLFNTQNKGLCVIDLDTVMPGYFISDVGDMMRTYLSPAGEEESDFAQIEVRDEFYKAIVQGYFDEMKEALTSTEKKFFFYSGQFMVYMQALRFLTDYLKNDIYYGASYEGHNLVRAKNQLILLERLMEKRNVLESSVKI